MRERTSEDDRIARKKHFKKGDVIQIRVFKKINKETQEETPEKIYTQIILEKTHMFEGQQGTYYKVWSIEEGIEKEKIYLHDIPEDKAEVTLLESSDEQTTTKSNG